MSIFGSLKEKVTQHVEVYVKLFKLNFIGRTANLLSYFMFAMICLMLLLCIVLFMGFGMVEMFIIFGLPKMGAFFATFGMYIIFLLIVIAAREKITRFFATGVIRVLTEGDEDDDDKKKDK